MEQNPTILAKKVWSFIRVPYFMLRKGISKRKLLLDLNMMIKRGKISGKALHNSIFHHHNNRAAFTTNHRSHHLSFTSSPPDEYEFSCTNSPANGDDHPFSLISPQKNHHSNCKPAEDLDMMAVNAVLKAMEMIHSEAVSPALPGYGRSPMVRQLRVTDSPFPLGGVDEDNHVDEAAEQFISRFYNVLRQQSAE
ncbi:uncharacterized protein LOC111907895 [Lactuca sativa]|uniref:uncharacterized protein LOC111907895 n=1 Tax=Lactuca sativa TaxID=4236 RepID=UPI000CB6A516|nr:uncharacterized protein LOC111907895 [Lactuca sativa]